MRHALGDLVDGAVSARADDQLRTAVDVEPGDRAGGIGPGGGRERDVVAGAAQDRDRAVDERASAALEFPGVGIVDEDGLFGRLDAGLRFLVKL
jgi:hypothetical protein